MDNSVKLPEPNHSIKHPEVKAEEKPPAVINFKDFQGKNEQVPIFKTKPFEFLSFIPLMKSQYAAIYIEGFNQPFYVKIKELSQKLGVSEDNVQDTLLTDPRAINRLMDVNVELQQTLTIEKVKDFITEQPLESSEYLKSLSQLKATVRPGVMKQLLIDSALVDDKRFRQTIIHIGKVMAKLKEGAVIFVRKETEHYGYAIDQNRQIYIRYYEIGKGVSKKASNSLDITTLEKYASLTIKGKDSTSDIEQELLAFKLLKGIKHIVPPYKFTIKTTTKAGETKWLAIQPLMDGTCGKFSRISPYHTVSIATHVSSALADMHDIKLIHGDVKPANMLYEGDLGDLENPAKGYLHDFGLMTRPGYDRGGTPTYSPPEIYCCTDKLLRNLATTPQIDSWGFGVSLLEMLTGRYNYNYSTTKLFSQVTQSEINQFLNEQQDKVLKDKYLSDLEKQLKNEMLEVVRHLMVHDPKLRWTCRQASDQLKKLGKDFPPIKFDKSIEFE